MKNQQIDLKLEIREETKLFYIIMKFNRKPVQFYDFFKRLWNQHKNLMRYFVSVLFIPYLLS